MLIQTTKINHIPMLGIYMYVYCVQYIYEVCIVLCVAFNITYLRNSVSTVQREMIALNPTILFLLEQVSYREHSIACPILNSMT